MKSTKKGGFYVRGAARWLSSMADSGSGYNVISAEVLDQLPDDAAVEFNPQPPRVLLRSANGQDVVVLGQAQICFTLNDYAFRDTFLVIDKGELCILGNDFIAKRSGTIKPSLNLGPQHYGSVKLKHQKAPGGWMQAVLVSSMDQLSQDEQDACTSDIASLISPGLSRKRHFFQAKKR